MRRLLTVIALVAVAPAVAGCLLATVATNAAIATNTVASVDQAVSDRLYKQCSVLNLVDGEDYCRSRTLPDDRAPVYCFQTLGGIDCYAEPDPYRVAQSSRAKPGRPLAMPDPPPETAAIAVSIADD